MKMEIRKTYLVKRLSLIPQDMIKRIPFFVEKIYTYC